MKSTITLVARGSEHRGQKGCSMWQEGCSTVCPSAFKRAQLPGGAFGGWNPSEWRTAIAMSVRSSSAENNMAAVRRRAAQSVMSRNFGAGSLLEQGARGGSGKKYRVAEVQEGIKHYGAVGYR